MKYIKLTQGKYARIDDEDFERVNSYKWCFNTGYAIRRPRVDEKKQIVRWCMHWEINGKPAKGMYTDHINRNRLDNRRCNLRTVTPSQNRRNTIRSIRPQKNNTSGVRGVYWDKERKKWLVQARIDDRTRSLGRFIDKFIAGKAYKQAVNSL